MHLLDPETGRDVRTATLPPDSTWVIAYSPVGFRVAAVTTDGAVVLLDLGTGFERRFRPPTRIDIKSLAYAPDGRHLAAADFDERVWVWDTAGDSPPSGLGKCFATVGQLVFSPDGRLLGMATHMWVRLWDPAGTANPRRVRGHRDRFGPVAFSPDGRILATGGWEGTIWLWDAHTGAPRRCLEGHTASVDALAISPDGRYLVTSSCDRTVRLWSLPDGDLVRRLGEYEGNAAGSYIAFTPDGRQVLSIRLDGLVWDVDTGAPVGTISGPEYFARVGERSEPASDFAVGAFDEDTPVVCRRNSQVAGRVHLGVSIGAYIFHSSDRTTLMTHPSGQIWIGRGCNYERDYLALFRLEGATPECEGAP